ncbi:cytochrome P450 [Schizophyllum fasciatum]
MGSALNSPVVPLLVALYGGLYLYDRHHRRLQLPLPPGPPGLPIVGNLFDAPTDFQWEKFAEWAKQYNSDLIYINVAGQAIVSLQSFEACIDLLERRVGMNTLRSVDTPMLDLMGWDFQFSAMKYGARAHRRAFHSAFNIDAARRFLPQQAKATKMFLRRMLSASTSDLSKELRYMVGSTIMDITYAIDAKSEHDPYIDTADEAFRQAAQAGVPGAYLVTTFPILKHIPDWMPGAGFKRYARKWKEVTLRMINAPYEEAVRQMSNDPTRESFVSLLLEKSRSKGEDNLEEIIRNTAALTYIGAMDTTVATILNFTLDMLANPEVQRRAQAELDSVLAPGQLPEFGDEERLPYITAIMRETMRLYPVAPMALPHLHSGQTDDVYRDFLIPKGAFLIPNTWALAHDENMYPDLYAYKPERFLTADGKRINKEVRDPSLYAFGFGRRICPGRHMALSSVWHAIASILRVYNIEKARRPDGTVIEPVREYKSSLLYSPEFFECQFVPRSEKAVAMIQAIADRQQSVEVVSA